MRFRRPTIFAATLVCVFAPGCIVRPVNPAATRPATAIDPARATPQFWLDQPPVAAVRASDFQALWTSAQDIARRFLFRLDRQDYRAGLITTEPLTSAQFFEFWRPDNSTGTEVAESSLATIRRTLRFEIVREHGGWIAYPKVLIERFAQREQRVTSVTEYRQTLSRRPGVAGSREIDRGIDLPPAYWYATGRDSALEKRLADEMSRRLERLTAQR